MMSSNRRKSEVAAVSSIAYPSTTAVSAKTTNMQFVDGGYGWVITACCFILNALVDGMVNSFGIVYIAITDEFNTSGSEATWILSLQVLLLRCLSPLSTALQFRFGARLTAIFGYSLLCIGTISSAYITKVTHLYVTMGVINGVGLGVLYQLGMTLITKYFDTKRGRANGISSCGNAIGTLSLSPLTQYLIKNYGFKYACVILTGLPTIGVLSAIFIVTPNQAVQLTKSPRECINIILCSKYEHEKEPANDTSDSPSITEEDIEKLNVDNNTNTSSPVQKTPSLLSVLKSAFDFGLFKNVNYVIFLISSFFLYMSYYVPYLYIPDRALHHDISKDHSSLLITIAGIASCVARTLSGFIADLKIMRSRRYLCYSTTLILCGVTTLFHFGHDFTSHAANAAVYGALTGSTFSFLALALSDLVGDDRLLSAFGMSNLIISVAALSGPAITGWLLDATGGDKYTVIFVYGGLGFLLSGLILLIIPIIHCYRNCCRQHDDITVNDSTVA